MEQVKQMQKALLLATLAFQQHWEKGREEEQEEIATMSEEELKELRENEDEQFPEEMEEEDFVEKFAEWLNEETLEAYMNTDLEASDEKRLDIMLGRSKK